MKIGELYKSIKKLEIYENVPRKETKSEKKLFDYIEKILPCGASDNITNLLADYCFEASELAFTKGFRTAVSLIFDNANYPVSGYKKQPKRE